MCLRLSSARVIFALSFAVFGCGRGAAAGVGVEPLQTEFDPEAVRALPGYRAGIVSEPEFGGEAYVMEAGSPYAPTVVLVHGLGRSGARDFYPVLPALAAQYHVVTFDLPGFGRSTLGHELYSPKRYVEFIHGVVGQRCRGPFNMVGHSMGGALSVLYAATFPMDVMRLILIDAAGILHRKAFTSFVISAGLENALDFLGSARKDAAKLARGAASDAMEPLQPLLPDSPDMRLLLDNGLLRTTILDNAERIAALALILENFGPVIAAVRAPTWILWGRQDPIASLRAATVLQARLPHAQLHVLDASGHTPMLAEPAATSQFLLEWLGTPTDRFAPAVVQPPLAASAPGGRCENQRGVRFSGDYSQIDIVGCQDVQMRDVRASAIRVRNSSEVVMENVHVSAVETALQVAGSQVEITASDFGGNVAIDSEDSRVDLAGVNLQGRRASVHVSRASQLLVSVCRVDSPISRRYVHDELELSKGAEL